MMTKEMLEMMTVKELRNYVKDNGLEIAKAYELRKVELVAAILDAENEMDCDKEDVLSNQEILKKEEECLNHEDDCTGFSPDMFVEAVELENSRTDYGTANNGWESIAKEQITHAYNWLVGENENTMQDTEEDSDEYKAAYNFLHDTENLINYIYREALNTKYDAGFCGGKAPKEMRFAGKEFCRNVIIDLLKRDRYYHEEKSDEEILDEIVSETKASEEADDLFYKESKENAKPIIKKFRKNVKYICPVCGNMMGNPDNFCGKCGIQLNHDSDRYDEISVSPDNHSNCKAIAPILVTKYGKTHKYCPHCNKRVDWDEDRKFCYNCGQEIEINE